MALPTCGELGLGALAQNVDGHLASQRQPEISAVRVQRFAFGIERMQALQQVGAGA